MVLVWVGLQSLEKRGEESLQTRNDRAPSILIPITKVGVDALCFRDIHYNFLSVWLSMLKVCSASVLIHVLYKFFCHLSSIINHSKCWYHHHHSHPSPIINHCNCR